MPNKFNSSRPGPYPRTGYPGPTGVEGLYNPDVIYQNPTAAVPGPYATENRGYWTGPDVPVAWILQPGTVLNPVTGVGEERFYRASWESPVFDLRPDLKASAGTENQAAYPIFRGGAFGAGGTLQILIRRDGGAIPGISNITLFAQEFAAVSVSPTPFGLGRPVTAGVDITSEFYQGMRGTLLNFIPPSNPVRYWKTVLHFQWVESGFTVIPVLRAQGVCQ